MKEIPLTGGAVALVDDADAEKVAGLKWRAHKSAHCLYAICSIRVEGKPVSFFMHRLVLNAPNNLDVDHKDGNGLNNQRSNLRLCTDSQNLANHGRNKDNSSGYKGVGWHKGAKKWRARIMAESSECHLGLFDDPADAARAYDEKALAIFGEFARLNFPR